MRPEGWHLIIIVLAPVLFAAPKLPGLARNAVRALIGFTPSGGSNFTSAQIYLSFVRRLAGLRHRVRPGRLNLAGLVKGSQLIKSWRITVFLVCLFSAVAAPGADATSIFYLAAPMLVLFFAAIGLCLLNDRRRERRAVKLAAQIEATADQGTPGSEMENL